MNSTAEILKEARKLIEKPENWTQGSYATDSQGNVADVFSDAAACFCAVGALMRASDDSVGFYNAKRVLDWIAMPNIVGFNDSARHYEVLELFSKAIAAAEASS